MLKSDSILYNTTGKYKMMALFPFFLNEMNCRSNFLPLIIPRTFIYGKMLYNFVLSTTDK